MKKPIPLILLLAATGVTTALVLLNRYPSKGPIPQPQASEGTMPGATRADTNPTRSAVQLARMSNAEVVAWLEKLGQVPDVRNLREMYLAQKTSWWGKKLDPKAFWRGRVVWADSSAVATANAHGRLYPPIPYADPMFQSISDEDLKPLRAGAEGTDVYTLYSEREHAFWDYFNRAHPMWPEQIAINQWSIAREANDLEWRASGHQAGSPKWTKVAARSRGLAMAYRCPPEALSDEALRWAFVMRKREEYQKALALPDRQRDFWTNATLQKLAIDPNLITEPLTDDQLKAADVWKIAYLQRLRREKTDESYINAYLQAWNLTPAEVFEATNK